MGSAELCRAGRTRPTSASLFPPSAPHPSPNFSETLQGGLTGRRGVAAVLKLHHELRVDCVNSLVRRKKSLYVF